LPIDRQVFWLGRSPRGVGADRIVAASGLNEAHASRKAAISFNWKIVLRFFRANSLSQEEREPFLPPK
jgi:hypothetical protein